MREQVEEVVNKVLENEPELFLIALKVGADNQIQVIIDGDHGVRVEHCANLSREIEQHLDREQEDYSLTVMSAGLSEPLTMPRQFKKNVGRQLKVQTNDGKQYKGNLVEATDKDCKLTWSSREKKPVGKGKITVQNEVVIAYEEIKEAKMMITF